MPPVGYLAADVVAILLALVALVIELRTTSIPNALTLPIIPLAFVMCLRDGRWAERGLALVAAIVVIVVLYRGFAFGGGVVKLIAGLCVVLGPSALAILLVIGARFGIARLRSEPTITKGSPWVLIGCLLAAGADYLRFLR